MNLQKCVPADFPPDHLLPEPRRHRGRGSSTELPLPRTPPYVPGLTLRGEERRYHRTDSICAALHTVQLANRGTSRTTVIQRAESMLMSEECRADVDCVWSAELALIYAGDLASAEAHCQSFGQDPAWVGSARHREVLTLARLRISMLSGHAPAAVEVLDTLLSRELPRSLSGLAIAWMVEILVQIGAFDRANGLLLEHDLTGPIDNDFPDRALVLAARGALHMAVGQFRHGIEGYRASGRLLTSWKTPPSSRGAPKQRSAPSLHTGSTSRWRWPKTSSPRRGNGGHHVPSAVLCTRSRWPGATTDRSHCSNKPSSCLISPTRAMI
jgi:hypothetical protein